jgi:hypothetical protein
VVDNGATTVELPVAAPGIQVYDKAPVAVSVELFAGQTAVGLATAVNVGPLFTLIKMVVLPLQDADDPVTV